MMTLSIAVLFNSAVLLYISFNYLKKLNQIKIDINHLDNRLNNLYRDQSYDLEKVHQDLKSELFHLQAIIIKIPKKDREGPKKKVVRRTKEQKAVQSAKRKAWWDKKRREQLKLAPDDIGVIQQQNWKELLSAPTLSNTSP